MGEATTPTLPADLRSFRQLVSQPLLLQSPLQGVLELLFSLVEAHESSIRKLQVQATAQEQREAGELRRGAAQDDQAARTSQSLHTLETRLEGQEQAEKERHTALEGRLQRLELRLRGASNMAGRQAALDDIASMLGVAVPEREVLGSEGSGPGADAAASSSHAGHESPPALSPATLTAPTAERADRDSCGAGSQPCRSLPPAAPAAQAAAESHVVDAAPITAAGHSVGLHEQMGFADPEREGAPIPPAPRVQPEEEGSGGGCSSAAGDEPAGEPATGSQGSPAARPGGHGSDAADEGRQPRPASPPREVSLTGSNGRRSAGGIVSTDASSSQAPLPDSTSFASAGSLTKEAVAGPASAASPVQGGRVTRPASAAPGSAASQPATRAVSAAEAPAPAGPPAAAGRTRASATPQPAGSSRRGGPRKAAVPAGKAAAAPVGARRRGAAPAADAEGSASPSDGDQPSGAASPPPEPRRNSDAARRLREVDDLLRRRPSVQEGGLLWKLQASLHEAMAEQERLRGEVAELQERLAGQGAAAATGLAACHKRMDGVEATVRRVPAPGGPPPQLLTPPAAEAGHTEGLEGRVGVLEALSRQAAGRLEDLDGQLAADGARLARLEAAREAGGAAATLVDALASGDAAHTAAALQGHLLAQQDRLAAQVEAAAAGIRQRLPGQVHDAVAGAAAEVGRRLSERLATKQELHSLSHKVNGKASREDVDRLLRASKAAAGAAAAGSADGGAGPAAGMKLRCLSCDSELQPFVFGAGPGALAQAAGTADLRYTQLPAASPQRNPTAPWTAAAAPLQRCGSGGYPAPAPQRCAARARPSTATSRLGHQPGWMQQLHQDAGSGADSSPPSLGSSRRGSCGQAAAAPARHPSLPAAPLRRPQTAAARVSGLSRQGSTGAGVATAQLQHPWDATAAATAQEQQDLQPDGASSAASNHVRPADLLTDVSDVSVAQQEGSGCHSVDGVPAEQTPRPYHIRLPSGGSHAALPALSLPGRIEATRPATAALPLGAAGLGLEAASPGRGTRQSVG